MNAHIDSSFPWPIIPGLIGFAIAFFVQFRLKHYIDRDKVISIENLADLYPNSIPPRKILNEKGKRLYFWFYCGGAIFLAGILLSMILYAK
jgi:hypothetical protein